MLCSVQLPAGAEFADDWDGDADALSSGQRMSAGGRAIGCCRRA
jgi:hypothetical protein